MGRSINEVRAIIAEYAKENNQSALFVMSNGSYAAPLLEGDTKSIILGLTSFMMTEPMVKDMVKDALKLAEENSITPEKISSVKKASLEKFEAERKVNEGEFGDMLDELGVGSHKDKQYKGINFLPKSPLLMKPSDFDRMLDGIVGDLDDDFR